MKKTGILALLLAVLMILSVMAIPFQVKAVDYSGLDKPKSYFMRTIGSLARADYYKNDILASVTLSQAIFESGWGDSSLAVGGKNLFGVKAFMNWRGKVYDQGTSMIYSNYDDFLVSVGQSRYNEIAAWRAYSTWMESVDNHSAVLLQYDGVPGEKDYKIVYEKMVEGGYCSDAGYADLGCKIVEDYDLTTYDDLTADEDGIVAIIANRDSLFLEIGDTFELQLTTYPENLTPSVLTWESDDESIATVDENGKITALSHGMTLITATLKNGREACCIVSVDCNGTVMKNDVYVYTQPDSNSNRNGYIDSGSSVWVDDSKTYSDSLGNLYYWIKGYNANGKLVNGYSRASNIFINVRDVKGIHVPKENLTLKVGTDYTVKAAVYPCDALDLSLAWSSSDNSVVSVDQNGVITAKAKGEAVITISNSGGVEKEIFVTVADETRNYIGLVSDGPVTVRDIPSYSGKWKGEVEMFGTVTVIGEPDGYWYKVSYVNSKGNTVTGYMNSTYIRIIPDGFELTYTTASQNISVYSKPDSASSKYGDIAIGEKIAIVGKIDEDWSHIVGNCTKGYAVHGYATFSEYDQDINKNEGFYGRVLANVSTVRDNPSQNGKILGYIPQNSQITIIGVSVSNEGFTWYEIMGTTADGEEIRGYADSGYAQGNRNFVYLYKGLVSVSAYLNVREQPDANSNPIGQLYNNDIVTTVGEAINGWYNVEYNTTGGSLISGYCSAEYMSLSGRFSAGIFEDENENEGNDTELVGVESYYGKVLVNASTLRENPSQNSKIVGKILQNTKIKIIGEPITNEGFVWYKINGIDENGKEITGYADSGSAQSKEYYVFLYEGRVKVEAWLNLRAEPNTSSDILDYLYNEDMVYIIGTQSDGWYKVEYESDGKTVSGYCAVDYVDLIDKVSAGLFYEEVPKIDEDFKVLDENITLNDDKILGVKLNTSVSDFISYFEGNIKVIDKATGNQLTKDQLVGTGDILSVTQNGETVEYSIVIKGDVNGDGKLSANDYFMVKRAVLGLYEFDEVSLNAALVSNPDATQLKTADYLILKRAALGFAEI